jgi:hypothetical protein
MGGVWHLILKILDVLGILVQTVIIVYVGMVLLLWIVNGLAAARRMLSRLWWSRQGARNRARSRPGQSPDKANTMSGKFNDPNVVEMPHNWCGTDMVNALVDANFSAVEKSMETILLSRKRSDFTRPSFGVDPAAFKPGTPLNLVAEYMKQAILDADDSIDPSSLIIQPSNVADEPGWLTGLL